MDDIRDFRVEIDESDVSDLRERLSRTRWPDVETVSDWSQGIPTAYVKELADYWANDYDMNRVANRLNAYPQFLATIDGVEVHFLHIRSSHEHAKPLIMTHGWPGSVIEYLDVIGALTEPEAHGGSAADAFHLVIPALPGFGFSGKPTTTGTGIERIGQVWDQLMGSLGYSEYFAHGGDWGAIVTCAMGSKPPEGLLGIHVTLGFVSPDALATFTELSPAEEAVGGLPHYMQQEAGYAQLQSTRPQTLGFGLADSPVGQLAWVVEKFYCWTDCDGHPENAVPRDVILDNVMLYWLTNSGASSARLYWESLAAMANYDEISVPSAYSQFDKELFNFGERWVRTRFTDLRHYNEIDQGGHFAALEKPDLFVREIRSGIDAMRQRA